MRKNELKIGDHAGGDALRHAKVRELSGAIQRIVGGPELNRNVPAISSFEFVR